MKKTALAIMLILSAIFCLLAIESQATEILVKGNPVPMTSVQIIFPEAAGNTYNSSTITMRYSAHFSYVVHRLVVYSLDGAENVTIYEYYSQTEADAEADINGSVILTGLSGGAHYIQIYAPGNRLLGGSDTDKVYFWVNTNPRPTAFPEPTPMAETFPATLVFVASVVIAVVAIGSLVYFKRRKGDENQ